MTPGERKALLFVGGLAVAGALARGARALRGGDAVPAVAARALDAQMAAVDSARRADSAHTRARGRPRAGQGRARTPPGEGKQAGKHLPRAPAAPLRVDMDVATAAQLESLPGVGPALAKRIVAYRDSAGPFGALERVDRVPGIGPALLRKLAPGVTFSLPPRPDSAVPAEPGDRRRTNPQRAQHGRTRRLQRAHR